MLQKIVVFVVLCGLLISGVAAQEDETLEVPFFLTFIPNIQFAPVYVAIENGYFANEGLNPVIQYGDEPIGIDLMAAGTLDFGVFGGEQVIQARGNGRDVVFIYEWFQQYPIGIVASVETGINEVTDLAGRRVGIPGRFGASYSGLIALLNAAGMTENDIELEEIGFNAPEVVCLGAVEAAVVYINNEPLQIQQRAEAGECGSISDVLVIPVSSAVDMISNGLTTSAMALAEKPDLVAGVVRAFDLGLRDAINNPAQAYLLSALHVQNLPLADAFRAALETEAADQAEFLNTQPDHEAIVQSRVDLLERLSADFEPATLVQFIVLLNTIDLWDAENLGYSDLSSWEVTQDILLTMGFIAQPIELEAAFTNAFVSIE